MARIAFSRQTVDSKRQTGNGRLGVANSKRGRRSLVASRVELCMPVVVSAKKGVRPFVYVKVQKK